MAAVEPTGDDRESEYIFIACSEFDNNLVKKIRDGFKHDGIPAFVEQFSTDPGHPMIDNIIDAVVKTDSSIFVFTPAALKSSLFAYEAILALERSQQLGKGSFIILLYNVDAKELPDIALLRAIPHINLELDSKGNWKKQQILEVIKLTKAPLELDHALPVGNVAHAEAWSHFFGFHNVIHELLKERIQQSKWYKEKPQNFPIAVYELIPKSCGIHSMLNDENIKHVGALEPIIVNRAGNKGRPYCHNVYCIEDDGQKYYCIARYPHITNALSKMEKAKEIDMDSNNREMQLARFVYTLNAILHHDINKKCHKQSRLLEFDDNVVRPKDAILAVVKKDVENSALESMNDTCALSIPDIQEGQKAFDTCIFSSENSGDIDRADEIKAYLHYRRDIKVYNLFDEQIRKPISDVLGKAYEKCRWIILLLTKDALRNREFTYMVVAPLLQTCIDEGTYNIIPVVEDANAIQLPDMLRWIIYIDMRTDGYKEMIYQVLKGIALSVAFNPAYLPAGNLGYGLAWGFVVNYMKKVLSEFGVYLKQVFEEKKEVKKCPEKLYLLLPRSCKCTGLVSDRWDYVQHFSSFAKMNDYIGGANIIKSLDIYVIEDGDFNREKYYFIGQFPTPVLCLWEVNQNGMAGIKEYSMRKEAERFCDIVNSLMHGRFGDGLHTKYEIVRFDDSDSGDLRKVLVPILQKDTH